MAKEDDNSQKSALGKGLAEVLARQDGPSVPEAPPKEEAKDAKTRAQEFLISAEEQIKAISGTDIDITDVEIEYLQARTAFAVGNFEGTLEYLEKINTVMEELEKEAEEQKAAAAAEAPPPPEDEEEEEEEVETPPPPPDSEETEEGKEGTPTDSEASKDTSDLGDEIPQDNEVSSDTSDLGDEIPQDSADREPRKSGGTEQDESGEEVLPEDKPLIFCMMCGEQITDDSKFCNWCGEKVD